MQWFISISVKNNQVIIKIKKDDDDESTVFCLQSYLYLKIKLSNFIPSPDCLVCSTSPDGSLIKN